MTNSTGSCVDPSTDVANQLVVWKNQLLVCSKVGMGISTTFCARPHGVAVLKFLRCTPTSCTGRNRALLGRGLQHKAALKPLDVFA